MTNGQDSSKWKAGASVLSAAVSAACLPLTCSCQAICLKVLTAHPAIWQYPHFQAVQVGTCTCRTAGGWQHTQAQVPVVQTGPCRCSLQRYDAAQALLEWMAHLLHHGQLWSCHSDAQLWALRAAVWQVQIYNKLSISNCVEHSFMSTQLSWGHTMHSRDSSL